ncbi:MAG: hypothetical protein U9N01_04380 [Euryarchaeota archaeon]|nr:hypothetical protein [Euryarchaeota archaeon]
MDEKEEEHRKRKEELYERMSVIRLAHQKTVGNEFKYIRGHGLVRR